ncbi:hypothetical protein [Sporosarcina sp. NPDC096371]|uniref:hypothetical protein n=1 Tax=Sporosarcina sp. NPDC096371 TaxID=3364530 RepID=UPI0038134AE1
MSRHRVEAAWGKSSPRKGIGQSFLGVAADTMEFFFTCTDKEKEKWGMFNVASNQEIFNVTEI